MKVKYLLQTILSLLICFEGCKSPKKKEIIKRDPCLVIDDSTFHLLFSIDTTTTDFYKLLDFIESKGEFSRFDKTNKIDSSFGKHILLIKILCEDKFYDSAKEIWLLDDVFSIRYFLTSKKPLKGTTNYFPKLTLTQFNFKTELEKDKAYSKIKEIGWGDPEKKWNDYYIVIGKTRIIVLESGAAIFSDTKERYGKIIQEEWINKNSR